MTERSAIDHSLPSPALPLGALLALAMASFVTVMTEALPAGLMAQISAGLGVPESLVGQLVTAYALGTMLTAIPLTAATRGVRRRPLLITTLVGFTVVNTVTALSTSYALTLIARGLAGVFAGLIWSLLAGYAGRLVPARLHGRAMAIAMLGIPLALSLGIPAGAFVGKVVGWRATFGILSGAAAILVAWATRLPDFPGQAAHARLSLRAVLALPGVRPVLLVTLLYVTAHNLLYTFLVPFLAPVGLAPAIDVVLLVFGVAALFGIWIAGALIDRWLRALTLASTASFALVMIGFALPPTPAILFAGVALWGAAYGGVPTLLQTASAKAAGDAAEVAQAMVVTTWNIAIAGGGALGAALLETTGTIAFPGVVLALLIVAGIVIRATRFPTAS